MMPGWTVRDRFSPRMWRCFVEMIAYLSKKTIFSTYVEVFLSISSITMEAFNFLHVCGGVSRVTPQEVLKF